MACNCTFCRCPDRGKHSDPKQWVEQQLAAWDKNDIVTVNHWASKLNRIRSTATETFLDE